MIARRLAAAIALVSLVLAAPARGDDVAEAKARFRAATDLYRQKRWREAVAEFEAAYRAKPHGAIHFNIAQCRERLEDWPGALRSYHDYLRDIPEATDRAAVRASMARIEARLASQGSQLLLVYTDPPGARVSLDGKERGTTPFHAALEPGSHPLSLALEGYATVEERVELSAAASRIVDVALSPVARSAEPAAAAPDLAARPPEAAAAPLPPPAPEPAAPEAPPSRKRNLKAWIAAGTAVAAAGAGAFLGWSARRDERAIDALAAPDRAAASARARDAQSKARAANALYALAGGAAAASGALLVLEARF